MNGMAFLKVDSRIRTRSRLLDTRKQANWHWAHTSMETTIWIFICRKNVCPPLCPERRGRDKRRCFTTIITKWAIDTLWQATNTWLRDHNVCNNSAKNKRALPRENNFHNIIRKRVEKRPVFQTSLYRRHVTGMHKGCYYTACSSSQSSLLSLGWKKVKDIKLEISSLF